MAEDENQDKNQDEIELYGLSRSEQDACSPDALCVARAVFAVANELRTSRLSAEKNDAKRERTMGPFEGVMRKYAEALGVSLEDAKILKLVPPEPGPSRAEED